MNPAGILSLAAQTVVSPRDVARLLLSIRPGAEALWTAFALVVVLNTLVFSASHLLAPVPVPGVLANPAVFAAMQAAVLASTIAALTWVGGLFGGTARLRDMALLLIWMQALRVLALALMALVLPLAPVLGTGVFMAITGLGLWILLNFIDEAHGLGSLLKAGAVAGLGLLAMAFALSIVLALAGVDPNGMALNV
ncbi:hypothetical protein JYP51_04055 [Ponticoccus gilvus]|nr:hypothetical protein [Enemella evansiae]